MSNHNHDLDYSDITHNHSGVYSATNHDHASVYSVLSHVHDGVYSISSHNHDSVYPSITHYHDSAYSAINHAHAASDLTDYVAPTTWVPSLVWSVPAPADLTAVYRYMKVGKLVTFWIQMSGSDGDNAVLTSISLPVTPANVGLKVACTGNMFIYTTRSDPRAYVVADNAVVGNRLLQFNSMSAWSNSRAYSLNITGQYEVA